MRLALCLVTALTFGGTVTTGRTQATMTMTQAAGMSDEALTRHVLKLFDHTPAVVGTRREGFASLARQTIQIERPAGFMMPGMFPVGFDHLTLVLRAKQTGVSSLLCEQVRVTLRLDPVGQLDVTVQDPPRRPASAEYDRTFIPIGPSKRCSELSSDKGAIEAESAVVALTGLKLFAQIKERVGGDPDSWLSCTTDWRQPEDQTPAKACRRTLDEAQSGQIFRIEACETPVEGDPAPEIKAGERCLTLRGARFRGLMGGEGWRAYIIYRPGPRPQVQRVRLDSWGYIV